MSTVSSMSSGTDYWPHDSGIGGESDEHRFRTNTQASHMRDRVISTSSYSRDSIMSSGSVSSATVTSLDFSKSRVSQGSIGSEDFLEIHHENNSTAEEELEQKESNSKARKVVSKRSSMKRTIIKRLSSNVSEMELHKKKGKKKGTCKCLLINLLVITVSCLSSCVIVRPHLKSAGTNG